MSTDNTFNYKDFHFTILSKTTCMIGIKNNRSSNAPIAGASYADILRIPEHAYDEEGNAYEVIETSRYCFRGCTKLIIAYLPRTMKRINEDMFYDTGITSLTVPRSVEFLDYAAFSRMTALKDLVFEDGSKLKNIGSLLMNECHSIRKIVLPLHILSIGSMFFRLVSTSTEINVFYCGKNVISNNIFGSGGNVTVHVTNKYPSNTLFGDKEPIIIEDDTCNSFIKYEQNKKENTCKCFRKSNMNRLIMFALSIIIV